jgi:hypothetical protein
MTSLVPAQPLTSSSDLGFDAALAARAERLSEELALVRRTLQTARTRRDELKADLQETERLQDARRVSLALAQHTAIDWAALMRDAHVDTVAQHRAANRALEELTLVRGVPFPGLQFEGYNVSTNQRVLRLSLIQGNPDFTAHALATLKLVLPTIEPCTVAGSAYFGKYVRVMDSALSVFGTHCLLIDEGRNSYQLLVKRHGQVIELRAAPDLAGLLNTVQEHCYYASAKKRD